MSGRLNDSTWPIGTLRVRRIGFGAMRLTGRVPFAGVEPTDRAQAVGVLRRAVELGVNHIDTAAFYFSSLRSANELINSALRPYPDDLLIATKVGPARSPSGDWLPPARPADLRGQVEENLRQLGLDHLGLVYLRVQDTGSLADRFGALSELSRAGLIRHLGVSGVTAEQLDEALAISPVLAVQNRYGIGLHRDEEVLKKCALSRIAFVPFFAVAGEGRHRGPAEEDDPALVGIAAEHSATVAQIRIAWTLHQGAHVLAIPGTSSEHHLVQNLAAADINLWPDEVGRLAKVLPPGSPPT